MSLPIFFQLEILSLRKHSSAFVTSLKTRSRPMNSKKTKNKKNTFIFRILYSPRITSALLRVFVLRIKCEDVWFKLDVNPSLATIRAQVQLIPHHTHSLTLLSGTLKCFKWFSVGFVSLWATFLIMTFRNHSNSWLFLFSKLVHASFWCRWGGNAFN